MTLFDRTAGTGLYDLRENSAVFWEVEAYQAALSLLEPFADDAERLLFPEQMERPQLEEICRNRGIESPDTVSLDDLKKNVRSLLEGAAGWTLQELKNYLLKFLTRAEDSLFMWENAGKITIVGAVSAGFCADNTIVRKLIEPLLPVGVVCLIGVNGMDFSILDNLDLTATELDERDISWDTFEQVGFLPIAS